jgi:hypothetical protein
VNPIFQMYLTRPISPPTTGVLETDLSEIVEPVRLTFKVENNGWSMFPTYDPTQMYRYRCESCAFASGQVPRVFRTTPDSAEKMKYGPTQEQREQINDHTRQHEIMWAWARGLN